MMIPRLVLVTLIPTPILMVSCVQPMLIRTPQLFTANINRPTGMLTVLRPMAGLIMKKARVSPELVSKLITMSKPLVSRQ